MPLLIGSYSLIHVVRMVSGGEYVEAKVTSLQSRKPWPGKAVHAYPVVSFTDREGTTHQLELQSYNFPLTIEYGSSIRLLFDPRSPTRALVDSWRARWAQPLLGVGFGLLLLASAFFVGRRPVSQPPTTP